MTRYNLIDGTGQLVDHFDTMTEATLYALSHSISPYHVALTDCDVIDNSQSVHDVLRGYLTC